jgi:hypothetical protein
MANAAVAIGKDAVPAFSANAIRVQFHRQADRAIKVASNALSAMHARIAAVVNRLLSGNANGISPHLQADRILMDAGISMMATKSLPCRKTLIGGKAPTQLVVSSNQSLPSRCSSARWNRNSASNGSASPKAMS